MRHRVAHRKLGRVTEHRIAMLRNQASSLLRYGHIETTVARGKELRPFVERIISIAKRSLDAPEGSARSVTARRRVSEDIADREVVTLLFDSIAPRFTERPGGYTRLLRLGHRRGDSADVAQIELVGSEYGPNAGAEPAKGAEADKAKKKTMGARIRERLGGKKKSDADQDAGAKGKVSKSAKGGGKVTTPRKSGGA